MRLIRNISVLVIVALAGFAAPTRSDDGKEVKEKALDAPHGVKVGAL